MLPMIFDGEVKMEIICGAFVIIIPGRSFLLRILHDRHRKSTFSLSFHAFSCQRLVTVTLNFSNRWVSKVNFCCPEVVFLSGIHCTLLCIFALPIISCCSSFMYKSNFPIYKTFKEWPNRKH